MTQPLNKYVLLVDDEDDLREVIRIFIQANYNVPVKEAKSGNEAIEILKKDPNPLCVICDYTMPDGNGFTVLEYIKKNRLDSAFVLCSANEFDQCHGFDRSQIYEYIQKPLIARPLRTIFSKLLKESPSATPATSQTDKSDSTENRLKLCKIRILTLLKLKNFQADVYLKLSDNRYVKILNNEKNEPKDILEKYTLKKITDVYIPQDQIPSVLSEMILDYGTITEKTEVNLEAAIYLTESAHETIHSFLANTGMTKEVEGFTKAGISLALKSIENNRELSELLKNFSEDKEKYLHYHSIFLAYISCAIAYMLDFKSSVTAYKLTIAAFLHDITLDDPVLARISRLEELNKNKLLFKDQQIEDFKNHPQNAADLSAKINMIPPDVPQIILNHHELPDGKGFPQQLKANQIQMLSAIFIIAHHMIYFFEEHGYRSKISDFVAKYERVFSNGQFKAIMKVLKSKEPSV